MIINDKQIFEVPVNAIDYDRDEIKGEEENGDENLLYYSPDINDEHRKKDKQLTSNVGVRVTNEIPEVTIF